MTISEQFNAALDTVMDYLEAGDFEGALAFIRNAGRFGPSLSREVEDRSEPDTAWATLFDMLCND